MLAGYNNQGQFSVAIGYSAGQTNQAANSIVISAGNVSIPNTTTSSTVIYPIRNDNTQTSATRVHWNTSTYEWQ